MKIPRILYVGCSNSGTIFWRMVNWWEVAHRTGKAFMHVLGWEKDRNGMASWQYEISETVHQPRLFGMLYQAGCEADLIIFGRVETDAALTTFYAMKDQFPNKPIVVEIDDDITDVPSYNQASETLRPGSPILAPGLAQFRAADGMIVSTGYLKEVYSEYNQHIHVLPNSIDFVKWGKVKRRQRPGLRIGWIGSTAHAEDLFLLKPVIERVHKLRPEAQFVFVSAHHPDFLYKLDGVKCVEEWVPILKYPNLLGSMDFDIGLAPLVDNKFNRAKSNLRWLEYSALKIPCVASKVGDFKATIPDDCAMLCESEDDWVNSLVELIDDRAGRKQMGIKAYREVEWRFNAEKNLDILLCITEDFLSRPPNPAPSTCIGVDNNEAPLAGIVDSGFQEIKEDDPAYRQEATA